MSFITWDNFSKPNFHTEFFLRNVRNFDIITKYNYEEFLDNPKVYSMVFADTYDEDYIDDDINIDVIELFNIEQQNININSDIEQAFSEQMIDESEYIEED